MTLLPSALWFLLPAAAVLLGLAITRSRRALLRRWLPVVESYPCSSPLPVAAPQDRFPQVYCLAHCDESAPAPFPGRFDLAITRAGFVLRPGLWYRGLPAAWLPWSEIVASEPAGRPLVRSVAPGLRIQLANPAIWFQIDDPAGRRLHRHWMSWRASR